MKFSIKKFIACKLFLIYGLFFLGFSFSSHASEYRKLKIKNHIVHKFIVNTKKYDIKLVKALDLPLGRESVFSISKRYGAVAGVNGGFFEVGDMKNGLPVGFFVSDKVQYTNPKNKSFSKNLLKIINNQVFISDEIDYENLNLPSNIQMVSGSDILLKNKIIQENLDDGSEFKSKPHARTSVCKYKNGNVGLYVIDHSYGDNIVKEIIDDLMQIGYEKAEIMKMSSIELLKTISNKYLGNKEKSTGMTLLELANFLKSEGCLDAINMDGGSSSTMVYDDKVVSNPSSSTDTKEDDKFVKEVSDAIIIVKKSK